MNSSTNTVTLPSHYDALVKSGQIKDDTAQRQAIEILERLSNSLTAKPQPTGMARWFHMKRSSAPARSLYIWGNVGRGKSMLMDLFFKQAATPKKRRVHFHAFMQEVHARMHKLRQENRDPVVELVHQLAEETRLLCFDELQATDVVDATLLFRLFSGLFKAGIIIVSTSNHPPVSLYTGGVQRERFAKFIALIESKMQIMALSSHTDYRREQIKSLQKTYFCPLGKDADAFITEVLERLCDNLKPTTDTLSVQGRITSFRLYNHSIGYFSFRELCEAALGSADYIAIAKRLDTVIIVDIPNLTPDNRNEAKRFVTLIDILYEHKVKLICTAATAPEKLYSEGDGAFEFQRTVSRLAEMGSAQYLAE